MASESCTLPTTLAWVPANRSQGINYVELELVRGLPPSSALSLQLIPVCSTLFEYSLFDLQVPLLFAQ